MRFKTVYQFLTGDRFIAKARGKKLFRAIHEPHPIQRRNDYNATRKHVSYEGNEILDFDSEQTFEQNM